MSTRNISRYHQGPMRGSTCPKCEKNNALARSRVRWYERVQKLLTARRPYRCHFCGERMWLDQDEIQAMGTVVVTRR